MRTALFAAAALVSLAPAAAQDSHAEAEAVVRDYLAAHPDEVGEIVKNYFIRHPEAVGQILAELTKRRPTASGTPTVRGGLDRSAAIASNAAELFTSPRQATIGDPHGDVTLVEFFDYNCGYCKRALNDTRALLRDDPHLKIVLKEFPILGPGSTAAARVAIAARMQDPAKYFAFHQALLGGPGPASEQKALDAARDAGFDMAQLARDMTSDEVGATLAENMKLAGALGFSGTPSYVIGGEVVMGAVGAVALEERIAKARANP
jgi:protein-disulfide isomerase